MNRELAATTLHVKLRNIPTDKPMCNAILKLNDIVTDDVMYFMSVYTVALSL